ncbi:universal stress protein [Kitasatospora purpeofusca]|uniref:universal stress protein n=1 Tax=Kitasatospora purpeofusca TaxID=67352 RepID=UPI002E120823|nr:universal stress protein [Kitasatospora purpeofusca]WSR37910.1 universal stress protein [Kitasatospora purpeofusca]
MVEEATLGGKIVVGVDGSEQSRKALRWAVRQAELTDSVVEAVMAWEPPFSGWGSAVPVGEEADLAKRARTILAETVEKAAGSQPPVHIRLRVGEGTPAWVLLAAAGEQASLLVVGHRGIGGFEGALLGSVGQYCVQHSPCPVVVVRGAADHTRP